MVTIAALILRILRTFRSLFSRFLFHILNHSFSPCRSLTLSQYSHPLLSLHYHPKTFIARILIEIPVTAIFDLKRQSPQAAVPSLLLEYCLGKTIAEAKCWA